MLSPRQRAVYFVDDRASQATLGYHCTVVRLCESSLLRTPFQNDLWVYQVYVPALGGYRDVAARDLLLINEVDESAIPDPPLSRPFWEIRFDSPSLEDTNEIRGKYRVAAGQWVWFGFYHSDQPVAHYDLSLAVAGDNAGRGQLSYYVPRDERLDRRFVLTALSQLEGLPISGGHVN